MTPECGICGKVCGPLKGETKSWPCAGLLSTKTRREVRLRGILAAESAKYQSPGKCEVRALLVAVAQSTCKTVLDFGGGGDSARAFAAAGLQVTCAENNPELWEALQLDADEHGYTLFRGLASQAPGTYDLIFADNCGNASTETRRELVKLAAMTNKWLPVTLATDHQINKALTVEVAAATLPGWLEDATSSRLEYISNYVRNDKSQSMWMAILSKQPISVRNTANVAKALRHRKYWATGGFTKQFGYLWRHSRKEATRKAHRSETNANERDRRKNDVEYRAKKIDRTRTWRAAHYSEYRAGVNEQRRERLANDLEYRAKQHARDRARHANRDEMSQAKFLAYQKDYHDAHREEHKAQAREKYRMKKAANGGQSVSDTH